MKKKQEHQNMLKEKYDPRNGDNNGEHALEVFKQAIRQDLWATCLFSVPPHAEPNEMMTLDVTPATGEGVHNYIQWTVSEMKSKVTDPAERMIDFQARENALIAYAWKLSATYAYNATWFEHWADLLNHVSNILNVVTVLIVVCKQKLYNDTDSGCGDHDVVNQKETDLYKALDLLLMILPISNGIIITITNLLDSKSKWHGLRWADQRVLSETYKYRARALDYSHQKITATASTQHALEIYADAVAEVVATCHDDINPILAYEQDATKAKQDIKRRITEVCDDHRQRVWYQSPWTARILLCMGMIIGALGVFIACTDFLTASMLDTKQHTDMGNLQSLWAEHWVEISVTLSGILLLLAAAGTCVCARWYTEGSVLRRGHIMQMEELDMRTVSPHVFENANKSNRNSPSI